MRWVIKQNPQSSQTSQHTAVKQTFPQPPSKWWNLRMDTYVLWTVCACAHKQLCVSENVGNEKDSNHPPPQFKSIRCDQEGMLYSTSGKTEVWMVWPLAGERATLERTRVLVRMLTWELTSNSSPKRLDAPGLCQGPGTQNTGLHVDKMPMYCVTITVWPSNQNLRT